MNGEKKSLAAEDVVGYYLVGGNGDGGSFPRRVITRIQSEAKDGAKWVPGLDVARGRKEGRKEGKGRKRGRRTAG